MSTWRRSPDETRAALDAQPYGSDVPLGSLLLAAHAAVLAALSGERDVVTGYAAGPAGPAAALPAVRSSRAAGGSW